MSRSTSSLIIIIAVIALSAIQTSSGNSLDDAEAALRSLEGKINSYYTSISLNSINLQDQLHTDLDKELHDSFKAIDDQAADLFSRINIITANASASGIPPNKTSECLYSKLASIGDFVRDIKSNVERCYGTTVEIGIDSMDTVWASVIYEGESMLKCNNMSLVNCVTNNENQDLCLDEVARRIKLVEDEYLDDIFKILDAEMANKLSVLRSLCFEIAQQELAIYPSMVLEYVEGCIFEIEEESIRGIC